MKTYTLKNKPGSPAVKKELKTFMKNFPGFIKKSCFGKNEGYRKSEKIRIFAKYFRGEMTGYSMEIYTTFYKPC